MAGITNKDIFEEFTRLIREENVTDEQLMKEYGGMPIYVPSWKLNGRNSKIIDDYLKHKLTPKELASKYDLSLGQIYEIIKTTREPSLL